MSKIKIAITGGGTGGHLVIAKALKEEAVKKGIEVIYLGSTYGQDRSWFEADEDFVSKYFFSTSGVVNKRGLKKVFVIFSILKAALKALAILRREKVNAVISVGGYSAAPASFAAILSGKPYFIHEQNATVGKLNALLRPFAKGFFSAYTQPPSDYPVRSAFFETARDRDRVKKVIFLGGSQGAKRINDLALSLAKRLQALGITIIHQCGKNDFARVAKAYQDLDVKAELFDFSVDIPSLLASADFAIARSGASTVWENTANKLPTLFIPYPYAANDHQAANAQSHVDNGAAWMMRENAIDEDDILRLINGSLKTQSQRLAEMLTPDGAELIIEKVLQSLKRK